MLARGGTWVRTLTDTALATRIAQLGRELDELAGRFERLVDERDRRARAKPDLPDFELRKDAA